MTAQPVASRPVYRFNSAIVRRPGRSVVDGLRAEDIGTPIFDDVVKEHEGYISALRSAGLEVHVLEPREDFPDSVFVEDPALVFTQGAILLHPGAKTRAGEVAAIAPEIEARFETVLRIKEGHVEGGDVLVTPSAVMIGLSERTDREGASALIDCLAQIGKTGVIVETPPNVLHFKSDCSLLDDTTILSTERLAASGVFKDFDTVIVPEGEEAAANALRVNDIVLVGADYGQTVAKLKSKGYTVDALPTSQIKMIDAGLSCMSLRWYRS